jgi:hypothetical protein
MAWARPLIMAKKNGDLAIAAIEICSIFTGELSGRTADLALDLDR